MTNLTEKITAYIAENSQAITLDMAAPFWGGRGLIFFGFFPPIKNSTTASGVFAFRY